MRRIQMIDWTVLLNLAELEIQSHWGGWQFELNHFCLFFGSAPWVLKGGI